MTVARVAVVKNSKSAAADSYSYCTINRRRGSQSKAKTAEKAELNTLSEYFETVFNDGLATQAGLIFFGAGHAL